MKNWIEKMIISEGGLVRLITSYEKGKPCWVFLKLTPVKYADYKKALKQPTMDIKDYGEILLSGWGEKPPKVACKLMKKKYNVHIPDSIYSD